MKVTFIEHSGFMVEMENDINCTTEASNDND